MNINLLNSVIADQKEELAYRKNNAYIKRELYDYAFPFLSESIIKVVTGVRRCGKSTFCHQLLENKKYAYLNFDDERLINIKSEDLNSILEHLLTEYPEPEYLFFDEIQNIPNWELFINRLNRQGYNIVLTGSNSKMLSRELATHLTGRHFQIELFPFSFREYLTLNNVKIDNPSKLTTQQKAQVQTYLKEYFIYGGFPEIKNNLNKKRYLRDLFDKIILRDIVERFKIRDISALKESAILLQNYFASLVTYNRIANILNFKSVNTVKEYSSYFEETYLLNFSHKHSFKLSEVLKSPRKVYSIDLGMITALSTSMTENIGRKMENLVYLNERRKSRNINYLSSENAEIDIVVTDSENNVSLIQVADNITNIDTFNREISAFNKFKNVFKNSKMILINDNLEDNYKKDDLNIEILPLWKYLLSY